MSRRQVTLLDVLLYQLEQDERRIEEQAKMPTDDTSDTSDTSERRAQIEARLDATLHTGADAFSDVRDAAAIYASHVNELLADNERLHAALAAAEAREAREAQWRVQHERAMEFVEAVASLPADSCVCWIDNPPEIAPDSPDVQHEPDCWIAQARALLAATEAEKKGGGEA